MIRVAEYFGDREIARSSAAAALKLAGSGPQLLRHKDLGPVTTDKATLRRLKRLSKYHLKQLFDRAGLELFRLDRL